MSCDLPPPSQPHHVTLHPAVVKVQTVKNKCLHTRAQYTCEQRGKQSGLNTGSAWDRKNKTVWAENDRNATGGWEVYHGGAGV